jgi:hypothetical protein
LEEMRWVKLNKLANDASFRIDDLRIGHGVA